MGEERRNLAQLQLMMDCIWIFQPTKYTNPQMYAASVLFHIKAVMYTVIPLVFFYSPDLEHRLISYDKVNE